MPLTLMLYAALFAAAAAAAILFRRSIARSLSILLDATPLMIRRFDIFLPCYAIILLVASVIAFAADYLIFRDALTPAAARCLR